MQHIADQILNAVRGLEAETRYEEKSWNDAGRRVESTNVGLRSALGGSATSYHGTRDVCDVVFGSAGERIWIEVKHSWTWMTYRKPAGENPARKKHLWGIGEHSALDDVQMKLPRLLGRADVAYVGLLVIALESVQIPYPLGDIEQLARLAAIDQDPWLRFERTRWGSGVRGYETIRIQPFLWLRPA